MLQSSADSVVMEECRFTSNHKRFHTAALNSQKSLSEEKYSNKMHLNG